MNPEKTSADWQVLHPELRVYDPDGWDRKNYFYSWYQELITEEEWMRRAFVSTCIHE